MKGDNIENGLGQLGLGCVTFGREIDKKTSFQLMDYAFSNGIRLFDTAAAYGSGASEQIVGAWMKERKPASDSVVIATKILPPYEPAEIRLSVDEGLKRLNSDKIDVLYLHRWDKVLHMEEPWRALDALILEGKVQSLGVSNFNAVQLADALTIQKSGGLKRLEYIQNNHNLAVSDVTAEIKHICRDNDIRIVSFSPLGAGFLTGKHQSGVQQGSRFSDVPAHQDIYFNDHAQKRLVKLLEISARTGHSPTHLALAWAIHQPDIASVLVGGRTVAHLDQAFEAAGFYSAEIFAELENE